MTVTRQLRTAGRPLQHRPLPRRPRRPLVTLLATLAALTLTTPAVADRLPHDRPGYYLSLGDSLASGYQPDTDSDTDIAYSDQLYEQLRQRQPGLRHLKLGCAGETTTTLIAGGRCEYSGAHSQLDAALKALRQHRGQVRYLTVTVGANDTNHCVSPDTGAFDPECMASASRTIARNLLGITHTLRHAGGVHVRYAGMTYYNPSLAVWLQGPAGQQVARDSAPVIRRANDTIARVYSSAGFAVTDVAGAFASEDFTTQVELPGLGTVPANVARICQWTWQCTDYRDTHANPVGHRVLAVTFAKALTRGHRP